MVSSWQRQVAAVGLSVLLLLPPASVAALPKDKARVRIPETGLTEDQKILHALNRLGYGPRPGEAERVRAMGLERWIERQLYPEKIPDQEMGKLLRQLPTLELSQAELMVEYPPPQLLRQIERQLTSRMGMDPGATAELFPELAAERERRAQRERRREMAGMEGGETPPAQGASWAERQKERLRRALAGPNRVILELSQAKLLRALHSERQLQEIMTDFWFNHFNVFMAKGTSRWLLTGFERDAIRPHALGNFRDLLGATARHPAMLLYLDNWQSADPEAGQAPADINAAYRKAVSDAGLPRGGVAVELLRRRGVNPEEIERRMRARRGAQGTGGMVRSPGEQLARQDRARREARDPRSTERRRERELNQAERRRLGANRANRRPNRNRPKRGLNENYARELLELHTLGVDGGYTQQDVIEVARCLTGWTLTPIRFGQQFVYVDAMHDRGEKVVLHQKIKNGGRRDGERVLDLLARHPSTARFLSTKLARRFVGDDPPESLVAALADTFQRTDGDIRSVLVTLFRSEEFWSPDAVNAKYKTPLTFVVSAARATGADIRAANTAEPGSVFELVLLLRSLGQSPYGAQPPTGYKETEETWVSTGALLQRMKAALEIARGRVLGLPGSTPALEFEAGTIEELVSKAGMNLLGRELSPETRAALKEELQKFERVLRRNRLYADPAVLPAPLGRLAAGWVLASPDFQRH